MEADHQPKAGKRTKTSGRKRTLVWDQMIRTLSDARVKLKLTCMQFVKRNKALTTLKSFDWRNQSTVRLPKQNTAPNNIEWVALAKRVLRHNRYCITPVCGAPKKT